MTVLRLDPLANNHDAWQDGTGVASTTGGVQILTGTYWGGMLLPAVALGATDIINSATLYYKPVNTTHDSPKVTWYAQATDNAGVFTTANNDISSRSRTTASVSDIATDIGTANYRAIDIKALISEVLARAGWASGNNIALIGDAIDSACDLLIQGYESGTPGWYVEIDYTPAAAAAVKMNHYRRLRS